MLHPSEKEREVRGQSRLGIEGVYPRPCEESNSGPTHSWLYTHDMVSTLALAHPADGAMRATPCNSQGEAVSGCRTPVKKAAHEPVACGYVSYFKVV